MSPRPSGSVANKKNYDSTIYQFYIAVEECNRSLENPTIADVPFANILAPGTHLFIRKSFII